MHKIRPKQPSPSINLKNFHLMGFLRKKSTKELSADKATSTPTERKSTNTFGIASTFGSAPYPVQGSVGASRGASIASAALSEMSDITVEDLGVDG